MKEFKSFFKKHFRTMGVSAVFMAMTLMSAFAADEGAIDTAAITSAFTTGFNSLVTTSIGILSAILPIAISFFAVKWVCVKGTSWFKSMAK